MPLADYYIIDYTYFIIDIDIDAIIDFHYCRHYAITPLFAIIDPPFIDAISLLSLLLLS